jgi:hypothetical protein
VSNINFASINENFPVAGQDNDTQVFRDNFDTIKTNFRFAQEEISDLQNNTVRTDQENDLNNNIVSKAVMRNNRDALLDGGAIVVPISVDYANGNYQIFRFGADITLGFLQFPNNVSFPRGVGKVTLELYSDGSSRTITLDPSNAVTYKKKSSDLGFTWTNNNFTVSSSSDPVIIEVWRHSNETIFVHYIGTFA